MHEMNLKAAGMNYLNIELDKTVRGQIINSGLTENVVEYAALDVKYLERIKEKQEEELEKKGLLKAIKVENQFVKCLAYIEFCGVKVDTDKWKSKMTNDSTICDEKLIELNT